MGIYSKDLLRVRAAVAAVHRGVPSTEVIDTFSISLTTLKRWLRMSREGKDLSPGVSTGRKPRILLATPEENKEGPAGATRRERRRRYPLQRHCEMWEEKRGARGFLGGDDESGDQAQAWPELCRYPSVFF